MSVWTRLSNVLFAELEGKELPTEVELPPLPHVVTQFCLLARDENVDLGEFVPILEQDSGFTYDLLKYCNSSIVGLKTQVLSVKQAMGVLGLKKVKFLLLRSSMKKLLKSAPSGFINVPLLIQESWERALFARHTAETLKLDTEFVLTAVILQDCMLPFLCATYPEQYQAYFRQQMHKPVRLVDFEQETFGWTHAELAALSMKQWHFPDELILSVLLHHRWELIVDDQEFRQTPALAVVAGSQLPDELHQEPDGFTRLLEWEDQTADFDLLDGLQEVDELLPQFLESDEGTPAQSSLLERYNDMMLQSVQKVNSELQPGTRVGSYQVGSILGRGGMGIVYLAEHAALQRQAVIKVLDPEQVNESTISSFEREVLLTSRLTHPNTLTVHDYGRLSSGAFYYAMEYVEGLTLKELVLQHGPLPDGRVIFLLEQVCASLIEAHHEGLVHRDLKPDNLMVSQRGMLGDFVTVLDFGLVASVEELQRQSHHTVCGTPHYLSPEAILGGQPVDGRSDLYSLGAVVYFLLTGQTLFQGETPMQLFAQHLQAPPPNVRAHASFPICEALVSLMTSCLEKHPGNRPQSVEEMLHLLQACAPQQKWTDPQAKQWWRNYRTGTLPTNRPTSAHDWDSQTITTDIESAHLL